METPKSLKHLLMIGYVEGISYILLLAVAMPLKYYADMPMAVRITGAVHGALFVWFLFALAYTTTQLKWSLAKPAVALIASIIPFGTFFLDKYLRK